MDYNNFRKLFSDFEQLEFTVDSVSKVLYRRRIMSWGQGCYHLPTEMTGGDFMEILARNTLIFKRIFLSLKYTLDAIVQLKSYKSNDEDFTLYYYSFVEGVVDSDLLALLAMFCSRNKVINDTLLKDFKLFERLDISYDGYLLGGPVHVDDLSIDPEAFGSNAGYLYSRLQSEKPEPT